MTTPIERGAEAAFDKAFMKHAPEEAERWADLTVRDHHPAVESWRAVARAVFESIDRDELADVIYPEIRLSPDHRPSEMVRALHAADAIIAHLTGDQS